MELILTAGEKIIGQRNKIDTHGIKGLIPETRGRGNNRVLIPDNATSSFNPSGQ